MKPFLIWFQHRSGSTHLVSLLNSHPEIKCKGEIFGCYRIGSADQSKDIPDGRVLGDNLYTRVLNKFPGRTENPSDPDCLKELGEFWYSDNQYPGKLRGFKFKFPSQAKLFPGISDYVLSKANDLNLIVLRRRNLLDRAVSVLTLEKLQEKNGKANVHSQVEIPPDVYDAEEIVRLIKYYQSIENEFSDWCSKFESRMEIEYQDLIHDQDKILQAIQSFLGVREQQNLTSKTRKIVARDKRQQIVNIEQLEDLLKHYCLDHYLKSSTDE